MVNYNNSKIYKLVCLATNKCYIGSTTKEYLSQRLVQHVAESKSKKPCRSKEIIDGGNYSIILLEAYPCNSRDELKAKEYENMGMLRESALNFFYNTENMFLLKEKNLYVNSIYKNFGNYYYKKMVDYIMKYARQQAQDERDSIINNQ